MQYDSYKDSGEQWLGQIPSHWEMRAIRYILQPQHKVVGKNANEYALLSLTLNGVIKRDMDNPTGKFPTTFDTYQEVNPDDFIFCMFDNEETPRAVGLSRYRGMITGAYDVMQNINALVNNRFLEYYFLDIDNFKKLKPLYKGLRKTVPLDSFKAMKIAIPPLDEQERMVVYLDKETAAIDAAIAQQQRMIDLLNERKQIIIQQAVTKGLDPNAKMKDSGIDWIGQIPEGWEVKPLKRCCENVREKAQQPNVTRISLENIESWTGNYIPTESTYDGLGILCKPNDVIFGKLRPYLAKVMLVQKDCEALGDFWVLRPQREILSKYLQIILLSKSLIDLIDSSTYGAKMPRADWNTNSKIMIPLPSIEEQKGIVSKIEMVSEDINKQILLSDNIISLLRERKQIIINEVVTGKIKV